MKPLPTRLHEDGGRKEGDSLRTQSLRTSDFRNSFLDLGLSRTISLLRWYCCFFFCFVLFLVSQPFLNFSIAYESVVFSGV